MRMYSEPAKQLIKLVTKWEEVKTEWNESLQKCNAVFLCGMPKVKSLPYLMKL